jgi:hypothetical protein
VSYVYVAAFNTFTAVFMLGRGAVTLVEAALAGLNAAFAVILLGTYIRERTK